MKGGWEGEGVGRGEGVVGGTDEDHNECEKHKQQHCERVTHESKHAQYSG